MRFCFVFLLLLGSVAANSKSYNEGKLLVKSKPSSRDDSVISLPIEKPNVELVKEFQNEATQESSYYHNAHNMTSSGVKALKTQQGGVSLEQALQETQQTRDDFGYRPSDQDPLFKSANRATSEPEKTLKEIEVQEDNKAFKMVTCQEPSSKQVYMCRKTRIIKTKLTKEKVQIGTKKVFSHFFKRRRHGHWFAAYNYYPIYKERNSLTSDIAEDLIDDQCSSVEAYLASGGCTLEEEGVDAKDREFQEEGVSATFSRPWWVKTRKYVCKLPTENTCKPLRDKGCVEESSHCIQKIGSMCVLYEKTLKCSSGHKTHRVKGFVPFCLDGNCDSHGWSENKDFAEAVSKLAVFREMAKDMDAKGAKAFPGKRMQCGKHKGSNCCKISGFLNKVGVASCKPLEKELATKRRAGLCHKVGVYKGKRKVFRKKHEVYCCFTSKLSLLLHQQGREQLGIGWGSAKNPNCRALTFDELKRIDFNKIDFSGLFQEMQGPINEHLSKKAATGISGDFKGRLQTIDPDDPSVLKTYDKRDMSNVEM